jgi:hypothetical protein
MANSKTLVSALAEEVADLLRHDNLDTRIYEWIGLAFNEMVQRTPLSLFYKMETATIASGASSVDLVGLPGVLTMAVFRGADDRIYLPQQLSPTDFRRLKASSGTVANATVPLAWTLVSDGTEENRILVFPGMGQDVFITLLSLSQHMESVPVGTDFLHLPYHFEHVVIWGAAALGAEALRTQASSVFFNEFENSLQEMTVMMAYAPDATPALRSLNGAYAGTGRLKTMPRVPDTIS